MALQQNEVLINGQAYTWSDIKLVLLGRVVEGIVSINFSQAQEKSNNMGAGNRPVARGRGNRTANASIGLTLQEYNAIQNALPPGKDILDIQPFPIAVAFTNEVNQHCFYELQHCEFTEWGVDTKQGDMDIVYTMPLVISQVVKKP